MSKHFLDLIWVQLPVLKLSMGFYNFFSLYSGVILDSKVFDTYGDSSAGNNLRDYLNSIKGKYVILSQVFNLTVLSLSLTQSYL